MLSQPRISPRPTRLASLFTLLVLLALVLGGCLYPEGPYLLQSGEPPEVVDEAVEVPGIEEEVAPVEVVEVEDEEAEIDEEEIGETIPAEALDLTEVLVRATFLLDREVERPDEQDIGEVEDLVFDLNSGRILYVILEYGGVLDIGDADLALPLAAFGWNEELEMELAVPEESLEALPEVDDDWPAEAGEDWELGIGDYWREAGLLAERDETAVPARVRDIINMHAGQLGIDLGIVEDLLLDLGEERILYVSIFTSDGFYDPDLVLLVPFTIAEMTIAAVGPQPVYALTLLEVEPEILAAAPAMDRGIFLTVDFIDPAFSQELAAFWEEAGFPVSAETE